MRTIRFHFDYLSPYAYVAWTQIHALAERHGARVEAVPVLFAALLNANGQKGPAEIPSKRLYVLKDAYRKAHAHGVPIAPPATHPFNPLAALRMSAVHPERALIDALYRATWVEARRIDLPEVVVEIASAVLTPSARPDVIARGQSDEAKAILRDNTERALQLGVFGVPTMLVPPAAGASTDEELFWGVDALPHLESYLRGEDPVPHDAIARWAGLPASASRTR